MSQSVSTASQADPQPDTPEVLTLPEAAAYLRVDESAVIALADQHELPGRKIEGQWRFHRSGLVQWLLVRSSKQRVLLHAGAMKDDPDHDAMLDSIYRERGRSMVEDKE